MHIQFNCSIINCNDFTLHNNQTIEQAKLQNIFGANEDYFLDTTEHLKQNCFEFSIPYDTGILSLQRFVSCMEVKLKQLCRYEKFNEFSSSSSIHEFNFYEIRRSVCEFVMYICTYLDSINWNRHFILHSDLTQPLSDFHSSLRRFLSRLKKLPDSLLNYAASNSGNSCNHPGYHIYHLHLELRWLYLIFVYSRLKSENITMENDEINNTILIIIQDLVHLGLRIFAKRNNIKEELKTRTPFFCTCTREFWLMLRILVDETNKQGLTKTFWEYVNTVLFKLTSKNSTMQLNWISNSEEPLIDIKNPEIFALWIIYHVNFLYGYQSDGTYSSNNEDVKSNHSGVEELLKSYMNKAGKDENTDKDLCAIIPLLHVFINEWWEADTKILKIILECFQSRINRQYFLPAFGPWNVTFDNQSPKDLLKQIKERVLGPEQTKESSFGLFLRLIGRFLYNCNQKNEPKYWKQLMGRIYTKININKVQDLTEDGLYNFLLMFLTLAVYADPTDVSRKIMSISIQFTESQQRKSGLIFKAKLAILLLYNELGKSLKELRLNENKDNFLNEVNQVSCLKSSVSLMRHYIDVLNVIVTSNPILDRDEHVLFDGWVDRYLPICPKNIFVLLSDMICSIFSMCRMREYTNHPMLDALWKNIPSRVRHMALDNNLSDDSENIIKIAFAFTKEGIRNPATAERFKHSAMSLFQHFSMSIMIKNITIIQKYLVQVLSNAEVIQSLKSKNDKFDQQIIQAWIRLSIMLGDEENSDLKYIKNYIINLNELRQIFTLSSQAQLFRNSNTPFLHFLTTLMEKRKTVQNVFAFDEKWRIYFHKIEKWGFMAITKENVEKQETEKIYNCISWIVFYCSPIFYIKNQPHNMLKSLISVSMLPVEDKAYMKNAGKRIFSMVVLGLESLNVQNDLNLHSLLQNLFDQYLPLLVTNVGKNFAVSDILLNCFTDVRDTYLRIIFEKVASFIVMPTNTTTHKHCYLVLILLVNLVQDRNRCTKKVLELLISTCVPSIITCFTKLPETHPHKKQTVDLLRVIFKNNQYLECATIRKDLENIITGYIFKNITSYSQNTFAFLNVLAPLNPKLILNTLPKIQVIIEDCERCRRSNVQSLKYSFEQLKELIKKTSR